MDYQEVEGQEGNRKPHNNDKTGGSKNHHHPPPQKRFFKGHIEASTTDIRPQIDLTQNASAALLEK